ncbi:MAG: phytanoyl-CoA dioxygenase family protein, partial [Lentisphaeria bacterium]
IIIRADVDESQLIDVPVAAGTLIVFDGLLVHGSGPNKTDRPRRVANMVAIVPTADGAFRKFDDTLNPYLRGVPA